MDAKTLHAKLAKRHKTIVSDHDEPEWQIILSALELAAAVEGPEEATPLTDGIRTHGTGTISEYREMSESLEQRMYRALRALAMERELAGKMERDASLFDWIINEPEGAKHLLNLLVKEGPKSQESFRKMIERIRASKQAALAAQGGRQPVKSYTDEAQLRDLLNTVAGVPCRFCFGHGNPDGPCPDCGKPDAQEGRHD